MKKNNGVLDILIIPGILPYPPIDGGKLCVFGLIDYLRRLHHMQVLLYAHDAKDKQNIDTLKKEWPEVTIHSVELFEERTILNESHKKNLFRQKMSGLLRRIDSLFSREEPAAKARESYAVHNSTPFYPHEALFIKKLNKILAENTFDIIQTEATPMLNLVNSLPASCKKVFVQIEGRGEILFDYGMSKKFDREYINHVAGNAKFIEYAFMKQYDAILALNDTDKIEIQKNIGAHTRIYTSPYGLLQSEIKAPDTGSYEAKNLIFLGSEGHYPNYDAMKWFLTDVLVAFKNFPFETVYVSGTWSKDTRDTFTKLLGCLKFIGFVEDLEPYLKNAVSIVPIRIGGGGIRTKILSSMARGTPVVTTSLGAVGITGRHGEEMLIADNAQDFANAVCSIFNDNLLAHRISTQAYKLVDQHYSQEKAGKARDAIYKIICGIH